jgi:hypothetical protein
MGASTHHAATGVGCDGAGSVRMVEDHHAKLKEMHGL